MALVHGSASTPLTARGREQAAFIAERCAKLPIDLVLGSTMTRAHDTAAIIAERIDVRAEFSDLFVECRGLSKFESKPYNDPEGSAAWQIIWENFGPGYRFADEENFDDRKERAEKALTYLTQRKEDHIVVATHGLFSRVLISYAVFGASLTARECNAFMSSFELENTGLSVLRWDEARRRNPWLVWVWNDHAHLG